MIIFERSNEIARANTLDECLAYVFLAAIKRDELILAHEKHVAKIKHGHEIIFMWHRKPFGRKNLVDIAISYERAEELIREMWNDRIIPYGCEVNSDTV